MRQKEALKSAGRMTSPQQQRLLVPDALQPDTCSKTDWHEQAMAIHTAVLYSPSFEG